MGRGVQGKMSAEVTQHSEIAASSEMIESLAAVYRDYGSYLSVLPGSHGDSRFAARMKEIIYLMVPRMFAAADESGVGPELKIEFVLSGVLATVSKWYEKNWPSRLRSWAR